MLKGILLRFLTGGIVVSAFAVLGDLLKPKSFAGLFGAAPSVALATLGLTVATQGRSYAATEARSMAGGAVAFFVYAWCVRFTGIDLPSDSQETVGKSFKDIEPRTARRGRRILQSLLTLESGTK